MQHRELIIKLLSEWYRKTELAFFHGYQSLASSSSSAAAAATKCGVKIVKQNVSDSVQAPEKLSFLLLLAAAQLLLHWQWHIVYCIAMRYIRYLLYTDRVSLHGRTFSSLGQWPQTDRYQSHWYEIMGSEFRISWNIGNL